MFGKSKTDELKPPPGAISGGGKEVLRAFIVDKGLQVSLRRGFDDPATWGLMLVDIARHAARIFANETGYSEREALDRISKAFLAEWNHSTDQGSTREVH